MSASTPNVPMVSTPRTMFVDAIDDRYRSTLRYLTAAAHLDAESPSPPKRAPMPVKFVRDVMVAGVVAAHEDAVFKEIVDALVRNRISAVPVIDADRRVLGVVSESDLLARVSGGHLPRPSGHRLSGHAETRSKLHGATARELMTAPAVVTTPDSPIADAARKAADARVRRLPVVSSEGVLVGIVTRADLLRPFLRPDEEIRMEITRRINAGSLVRNSRGVEVNVEEGIVYLRGQLERKVQANTLVDAVRDVPGVIDVDHSALTYVVDDPLVPRSR